MTTFTELSQPPDFGSDLSIAGKSANRKNGAANADENVSMPSSGHIQSPLVADTSVCPMNGPVQVNEVMEKSNPISSTETKLSPFDEDLFKRFKMKLGTWISKT